jgi:hypothetical protein
VSNSSSPRLRFVQVGDMPLLVAGIFLISRF